MNTEQPLVSTLWTGTGINDFKKISFITEIDSSIASFWRRLYNVTSYYQKYSILLYKTAGCL